MLYTSEMNGQQTVALNLQGDTSTKHPGEGHSMPPFFCVRRAVLLCICPLEMHVPGRDVAPAIRSDALTCTPNLGVAASGRQIVSGPFGAPSRPRLQEARRSSTDGPSLSYTRAVSGAGARIHRVSGR